MQNMDFFIRKKIEEDNYFNKKLDSKFKDKINNEVFSDVLNKFYEREDIIKSISKYKNVDENFIKYNNMFKYKLMHVLVANHVFNENDIHEDVFPKSKEYQDKLINNLYEGILNENLNDLEICSLFLSNPAISNILSILDIIDENIKKNPNDFYNLEFKHIIDSLKSMIILFNYKCFPQAMSVFRQALEQYITLVALEQNKNAIESFLNHQAITIKDATKKLSKEELDEYIVNNNLTYNTYKSYMNYGWLDSIKKFRELKEKKPNTKYSIKTVAQIANVMNFYDAMDFASNYVHSNFVFLDVDWNMVLKEVLDGVYEIVEWCVNSYKKLYKDIFIINDFDYFELFKKIEERTLRIIKDDNYCFF